MATSEQESLNKDDIKEMARLNRLAERARVKAQRMQAEHAIAVSDLQDFVSDKVVEYDLMQGDEIAPNGKITRK